MGEMQVLCTNPGRYTCSPEVINTACSPFIKPVSSPRTCSGNTTDPSSSPCGMIPGGDVFRTRGYVLPFTDRPGELMLPAHRKL